TPDATDDDYTLVTGRKRRAVATPRKGRPPKAVQEAKRQPQNDVMAMDLTPDANSIEKFLEKTNASAVPPTAEATAEQPQGATEIPISRDTTHTPTQLSC
ncbi:hypothetical protein SEPCBS119000_006795, partial [Sporothrix epigloea]